MTHSIRHWPLLLFTIEYAILPPAVGRGQNRLWRSPPSADDLTAHQRRCTVIRVGTLIPGHYGPAGFKAPSTSAFAISIFPRFTGPLPPFLFLFFPWSIDPLPPSVPSDMRKTVHSPLHRSAVSHIPAEAMFRYRIHCEK